MIALNLNAPVPACFTGAVGLPSAGPIVRLKGNSCGRTPEAALLPPTLRAAEGMLPRDLRAVIDGFAARNGVISDCFQGVLSAPTDQEPRRYDVIFETPARAPFALQVAAAVAALVATVAEYRGFISYAHDL